jgi:tRNA U55 pseudouridine synthase TruB
MAGPFHEKNAILLDSLLQIGHNTELMKYVLPLQDALVDILALEIQDIETVKLRQGQADLHFP